MKSIEAKGRMVVTTDKEVGEQGDVDQRVQNCSYAGWIIIDIYHIIQYDNYN